MDIAASIVTLALEVNRNTLFHKGIFLNESKYEKNMVFGLEGDIYRSFLRPDTWRETQRFNNLFLYLEKGISTHLLITIVALYFIFIRS